MLAITVSFTLLTATMLEIIHKLHSITSKQGIVVK
jgi:hypothetical protein